MPTNTFELVHNLVEQLEFKEVEGFEGKNLAFFGMGGSGIVGDLTVSFLLERGFKRVCLSFKGSSVPPYIDESFLAVCISYSGNTRETLKVLEELIKRGVEVRLITSGGKMEEIAKEKKLKLYKVPPSLPPRFALGHMLSYTLSLCKVGKEELKETKEELKSKEKEIKELAEKVSKVLYAKVPVIYSTYELYPVAYRWKTQINENSKAPAYSHYLPEIHHNEVEGYQNLALSSNFAYLILHSEKSLKEVEATEEVLRLRGFNVITLEGKGSSFLSKALYLTLMGDYLSMFLAKEYSVKDPIEVKVIKSIKEKLRGA